MKACPVCERGELIVAEDISLEIEGDIIIAKRDRCTICGEEFLFEHETQRAITIARRLGAWPEPLKLYRNLLKSGNSLVFRMPSDLERQLKLDENTGIAISRIGNKIVIEAQR